MWHDLVFAALSLYMKGNSCVNVINLCTLIWGRMCSTCRPRSRERKLKRRVQKSSVTCVSYATTARKWVLFTWISQLDAFFYRFYSNFQSSIINPEAILWLFYRLFFHRCDRRSGIRRDKSWDASDAVFILLSYTDQRKSDLLHYSIVFNNNYIT